jgi:hypothetical protein
MEILSLNGYWGNNRSMLMSNRSMITSGLMDTDGLEQDCPDIRVRRRDKARHNITRACESKCLETGSSSTADRQPQSSEEMLCTEVQVAHKRICTETSRTGTQIEDDHWQVSNGSNSERVDYLVIRSTARSTCWYDALRSTVG